MGEILAQRSQVPEGPVRQWGSRVPSLHDVQIRNMLLKGLQRASSR